MSEATVKARGYALTLANDRDIPDGTLPPRSAQILHRIRTGDGYVDGMDCSRLITLLQGIPRRHVAATGTVRPGCFTMDDRIWIVTERQDGRGVYAKLLVETPGRIRDEDGERVGFDLTYDRDTSRRALEVLTEAHRMTFAVAKDFMVRYGRCFAPVGRSVCGLRLKAADSVALSIGPVCGPKFPGYHEAVEELRAGRKHDLYQLARDELGIITSDVELYRIAGPQVSTVAGIERKLDSTPV